MTVLTKTQARMFILAKQGLLGSYRFSGKDGAFAYVRQAGCIQYDPVDVCGKNAELTLQSRVKGFRKSMLAELLYKDRLLVDYADKELSIWPAEDWPYFSPYRERSRELGESFPGLAEIEQEALAYIRANGPVSSDMLPITGEIFWHSSMHWSGNWHKKSKAARSVLEQLYTDGTLVIHHKNGSRKFYDLAERHLKKSLLTADCPCDDDEELLCWRVLRRIGAVGLLWDKNSPALLGIELNADRRKSVFSALEERGAIRPAQVEGIKSVFYYRTEDEPLMRAVLDGTLDTKPRMEFLAPLDPLMWDKALVAALWDFRYSWEIYTPAGKRQYGYYTLPVLWGCDFIGRIEAASDQKSGTLCVKNIWLEPGVRQTKKLRLALDRALRRFARFNDCTSVIRDLPEVMKMKYKIMPCVEEDEELIEEKLDAIDYSIVPPDEGTEDEELVFKITDHEGKVIAGCLLEIDSWKIAELDVLWVDEKYRKKGLGSALIRAAEKAARERDCYAMILGTFDFQARPLYEKHGYTLCGTIKDFPKGHANYALMKRLDRRMQEYLPSVDLSGEFEIVPGDGEDAETIGRGLADYNTAQVPRAHKKYIPLNKKLLDEDGKLIAAIFAGVGRWNSFEIDMMWVDEPYRNQGIGSELLAETEREAKEQGAYFALAEGLFDWQSAFFKKNGYTEVGTLEDCPKGHRMVVLEKRF